MRPFEWFFFAGLLVIDFPPLHVFRYFLFSDLLFLLSYFLLFLQSGRMPWHLSPPALYVTLALYSLSALLSLFRAPNPENAFSTLIHLMFLTFVYVPLVSSLLRASPRLFSLTFVGFIVITIVRDIDIILLPLAGIEWQSGTRLSGLSQAPTLYVMLPGMMGLCLLLLRRWPGEGQRTISSRTLSAKMRLALLPLGGIVLSSVAFMITRFRSIWIACFCGLFLLSVMLDRRRLLRALTYPTLAALLLVFLAINNWLPAAIVNRFSSSFDPYAPDIIARREVVWRLLPIVSENPFLGIGFNNSKYFLPLELVEGRVDAIHNLLLSNLVENGLLSFLALVALPLLLWSFYRRVQRRGDATERYLGIWGISSCLGIYLGAQLTPNMLEHTFWFLIAYLTGLVTSTTSHGR